MFISLVVKKTNQKKANADKIITKFLSLANFSVAVGYWQG